MEQLENRLVPTGTISGSVFNDLNANGVFNVGEPGLAGVTINLYKDANADGILNDPLTATQLTNSSGAWSFFISGNVNNETYFVQETNPAGYGSSAAAAGSGGGTYTVVNSDLIKVRFTANNQTNSGSQIPRQEYRTDDYQQRRRGDGQRLGAGEQHGGDHRNGH